MAKKKSEANFLCYVIGTKENQTNNIFNMNFKL